MVWLSHAYWIYDEGECVCLDLHFLPYRSTEFPPPVHAHADRYLDPLCCSLASNRYLAELTYLRTSGPLQLCGLEQTAHVVSWNPRS